MRILTTLIICLATASSAENWMLRSSDQLLEKATLDNRLRGQTITFFDDAQAEYFTDGRYRYTYANDGGAGHGYYKVGEDSTVCIEFVNGFQRCDAYVLDAQDRLVVVTEKGDRFPVRN
jgi:hypothetical protein